MTKSQRLALRRSEIRERLNEIAGLEGDDLTEEIRQEAASLQTEFQDVEVRWRAAVVAEGDDDGNLPQNGEDAERRVLDRLVGRATIGGTLQAAMD